MLAACSTKEYVLIAKDFPPDGWKYQLAHGKRPYPGWKHHGLHGEINLCRLLALEFSDILLWISQRNSIEAIPFTQCLQGHIIVNYQRQSVSSRRLPGQTLNEGAVEFMGRVVEYRGKGWSARGKWRIEQQESIKVGKNPWYRKAYCPYWLRCGGDMKKMWRRPMPQSFGELLPWE